MAGGDGDAPPPRRRELTGLVADAGVVGKAKAGESRDELRRERQPAPGERRSLYFAQHPDFMGRPPPPLPRPRTSGGGLRPLSGRENANFRCVNGGCRCNRVPMSEVMSVLDKSKIRPATAAVYY